jgi:hypothetical protein
MPHFRRSIPATDFVPSGDLACKLFEQPHPQRRKALKYPMQRLDGQQQHRPGHLSGQRESMQPRSKRRRKFNQVASARRSQTQASLKPLGSPQKLPRNHYVQPAANLRLPEHNLTHIHVNAPCSGVQKVPDFRRAGQKLCQRTSLDTGRSPRSCLREHRSISKAWRRRL